MAAHTEPVPRCPLCDDAQSEMLFPAFDRLHRKPGGFCLVRCTGCRLVRLSPRPALETLLYYYPEDEYYGYQEPASTLEPSSAKPPSVRSLKSWLRDAVLCRLGYPVDGVTRCQRVVGPVLRGAFRRSAPYGAGDRFPPYRPNGRALDIGCGSGIFLSHLKRHGWEVAGVDISPGAAKAAKKAFDIDVYVGSLEAASFDSGSFDFINMSHVIEHVPDPCQTLRVAAGLLKPGGELYLETPNAESFACTQAGPHWVPWEAPRHLQVFSATNLRQLFTSTSIEIVRIDTVSFGHYEWEETYREEERAGAMVSPRPLNGASLRLRGRVRGMRAFAHRLFHPMSGEIIRCWAQKEMPS